MATPHSLSFFKYVLSSSLILMLISFSLRKGLALEETQAGEINFHSVHISSILQPSSCKPTTSKGPNGKASLTLVHRHGPCHEGESNPPTLARILELDQSRVASIQARQASNSKTNGVRDSKVTLPAQPGTSVGSGNYVVKVGLGTPAKLYTLVFDTGSDLTWTQCQPCVKFCHPQTDPIYDPSKSSTYSNVSCASTQCSSLASGTGNIPGCSGSTCVYLILYGDQSFSIGLYAKETLTLGSDAIPGFYFGCGQNNQGIYGKTDGLLGLGRNPISLVSQTAYKYGKVFSYCLPKKTGTGFLSFGKGGYSTSAKFTPLVNTNSNSFYSVSIQGISVAGRLLAISPSVFQTAGTVIDSGTVVTRLPPAAYSALRSAFRQFMAKYTTAPAFSILDTCYDLSGQTTVLIPKISFIFGGNVNVDLAPTNILLATSPKQVCLAFAGNSGATDIGIFGNTQQQTFQVVYDVAGGRIGFGAGAC